MPEKQVLTVLLPAAKDNGDGSITMRGYPLLVTCKQGYRSVVLEGVEITSASGVVEVWIHGPAVSAMPRKVQATSSATAIGTAFCDRSNPLFLTFLNCSEDAEVLIGVQLTAYADGE